MSNPRPALFQHGWSLLLAMSVGLPAAAQDQALLDEVRMQRPDAAAMARAQLEACQHPAPVPGKKAPSACPDERRLSLLLGVLLVSDGDAAAGAVQLAKVKAPRGLEPFHAWYLGEAQSWSGAKPAALKNFEKARQGAPGWLLKRIEVRVAEVQLAMGKAELARPTFEALATEEATPEVLYPLSLAKWMMGEKDAARADWKTLALRFPGHPHAALARELLARLGSGLVLTAEERFRLAQAWLGAGEPSKALGLLEDLELAGKGGAARVALVRGQALLARGKDVEAAAALESAATEGTPTIATEALLALARRQMRLGENAAATRGVRSPRGALSAVAGRGGRRLLRRVAVAARRRVRRGRAAPGPVRGAAPRLPAAGRGAVVSGVRAVSRRALHGGARHAAGADRRLPQVVTGAAGPLLGGPVRAARACTSRRRAGAGCGW